MRRIRRLAAVMIFLFGLVALGYSYIGFDFYFYLGPLEGPGLEFGILALIVAIIAFIGGWAVWCDAANADDDQLQ